VIEATGVFRDGKLAGEHLKGGAKKVIISAPGTNVDYTVVLGVNEEGYDPGRHDIVSNASCTTNCLAPVVKVLDDSFQLRRGLMTTVHAYTTGQGLLDVPHKDMRRARAAALSIIPTTTGAARAIGEVLPHLDGKLNGMAMRVPTSTVSVVDLTAELEQEVDVDMVNQAFIDASQGSLNGILGASSEPLVSIDYKGDSRSSIVDLLSTQIVDARMVKVLSWYDNEWGYSCRVVDLAQYMAAKEL
jgi:glyceraldehyde 3-phosphate dehydrogenase